MFLRRHLKARTAFAALPSSGCPTGGAAWPPPFPVTTPARQFPRKSCLPTNLDSTREGFREAITAGLADCGITLNVLREEFTNFSRELAFKTIEPVMTAHPEINVVFGANSNTALGIMEGLQATGISPGADGVWIAGQGGQLDELAAVCRGEIMTVPFRDPRKMSDIALEVVRLDLAGKTDEIEPVYPTQLVPITNCDQIFETVPQAMLESKGFRPLIPEEMWDSYMK